MIKDQAKNVKGQLGSNEDKKVSKIDQLIQNYSVCLSEKRQLIKKNVGLRLKDIQDRKQIMRSSVISQALPDLFVKELRSEAVEKYFVIHEIVEKVN